ncbi:MAG: hypothetical protein LBH48_00515 [Bifidobacteriaceae bacterium]|jgi:endonuclease/exonuclease/phosphatase family metal-dependent hydrolase|nr:hypothetical protein [Bifidobacteriaceae bacterium]
MTVRPSISKSVVRTVLAAALAAGGLTVAHAPSALGAPAAPAAQTTAARAAVSAKAKVGAPKKVKIHNNYGKFKVTWKKPAGAIYFRMVVASNKAMTKVLYKSKITKQTNAWTKSKKIVEGGKYWVTVQSFGKNKVAGKRSAPKAVTTKIKAPGHLDAVRTVALSPTALRVTWSGSAARATGYRIDLSPTLGASPTYSQRVNGAKARGVDLTDLAAHGFAPGSQFYVTAVPTRYFNRDGGSRIVAAALPFVPPAGAPAFSATVSSYNVRYSAATDAAGRGWAARVPLLAARLAGSDIVGIQEAGGKTPGSGVAGPDMARATGLTRVNLPNGEPCSQDKAIDILLNANRFAVEECHMDQLPAGDNRWLLTVKARERASDTPFLIATTHLIDGKEAAAASLRQVQTNAVVELLARYNQANMPVILTGDLNSAEASSTMASPTILASAGYLGADLVAPNLTNAEYTTSHGWTKAHEVAEHIDHIMANYKVVASSFGIHYGDPAAEPSDHFAISASLSVYP